MRKFVLLCMSIILIFSLTSCDFYFITTSKKEETIYSFENDSLKNNGPLTQKCMPSIGDVNVLVIPINFTNTLNSEENKELINKAFNKSNIRNNNQSVSSYYKESSYGKLKLSFEVLDWFTPVNDKDYYENYNINNKIGTDIILDEALNYYDNEIDYSLYDSDNDNYIDAVWMIYDISPNSNSDFWWAFTSLSSSKNKYDGKKTFAYSFGSFDFIYSTNEENEYDAKTYIHETGHLMGLDDYYSYNSNVKGPLYGADMMDYDLGDHSSFSKILLGWIKPTIIKSSGNYEIYPLSKSSNNNVLLISNHEILSIYDEYILIDYFTNEGLNYNEGLFKGINGNSEAGIRVYHANGMINFDENGSIKMNNYEYYQSGFKYNNSMPQFQMLKLLGCSIPSYGYNLASSNFLYTPSSLMFGCDVYQNYQFSDLTYINFSMKVNSLSDVANISINLEV